MHMQRKPRRIFKLESNYIWSTLFVSFFLYVKIFVLFLFLCSTLQTMLEWMYSMDLSKRFLSSMAMQTIFSWSSRIRMDSIENLQQTKSRLVNNCIFCSLIEFNDVFNRFRLACWTRIIVSACSINDRNELFTQGRAKRSLVVFDRRVMHD